MPKADGEIDWRVDIVGRNGTKYHWYVFVVDGDELADGEADTKYDANVDARAAYERELLKRKRE